MNRFREKSVHFDRSESSWTENCLRNLWNSMFSLDNFHGINEKSAEIQGISMLVETILISAKQLYNQSCSTEFEFNKSIQVKDKEIAELKENIKSLKTTCSNCSSLKKELNDSRKKVRDVEHRMSSIAKILNFGGDKNPSDSENFSSAANLVSQMLYPGTPKRKKRPKDENSPVNVNESILAGPTPYEIEQEAIDDPGCVPETEITPKKSPSKTSVEWRTKKRKVLSSSLSNAGAAKSTTPKKNLSADSYMGKGSETPEKRIQFNLNINCFSDDAEKETQPTAELVDDGKLNNSELERIWFGGEKKQNVDKFDKQTGGVSWKLKETPSHSFMAPPKKGAKNLKQLTLGVVKSSKQVDITQMEGFGDSPSKDSTSDYEDDVIKPSPKRSPRRRKGKKRQDTVHKFAPLATSTQIPRQLEDSFDKIPEKISKSPKYKYKGSPVRKKEDRLRLEGGECQECEEYFRIMGKGMDAEALRARKNTCSRHREKYQRSKTPPGFWDPNIPDTPECRAQGLYTSVYRLQDDK